MKWICATTAPWALAAGLLVSFTASASNNAESGISFTARTAASRLSDSALVPPVGALIGAGGVSLIGSDILRNLPRYDLPESAAIEGDPLRADRKAGAGAAPVVERSRKGDPDRSERAGLIRRADQIRASMAAPGSRMLFTRDENLLPPTILMEGKVEGADAQQHGFEPWQGPEFTTTRQASSVQSPMAAAAGSTGAAAGATTPSVRRAVVLSSTTPTPADTTPVEIAAAPVSRIEHGIGSTIVGRDSERPRYADFIDPDNLSKEQRCLAEAVYFEARSEPPDGQAAVAQVVLNRMKSGLYPASVCGVVYQNRNRHLACQFTFACEGKALRTTESEAWESAKQIASAVLEGKTYLADVGGATHYHANYVRPYWAKKLKKMDVIGRHIFYKLRPGQT
ncbi:cell wall hydrolase [Microvirga antarctica]|uniref:cell wall hydrolase n=1 Tax=Microvirga antarctica TaxID=2819233 RepID=UPI001B307CCC|nr:cell wall hydrolase [Microvirga antarctica]